MVILKAVYFKCIYYLLSLLFHIFFLIIPSTLNFLFIFNYYYFNFFSFSQFKFGQLATVTSSIGDPRYLPSSRQKATVYIFVWLLYTVCCCRSFEINILLLLLLYNQLLVSRAVVFIVKGE